MRPCAARGFARIAWLLRQPWRQKAVVFLLHDRVALAAATLQRATVEDGDPASGVADDSGLLQFERAFGDAFPAHAQHVRDQLLGHHQLVALQAVQAEEEPPAELLVERMAVSYTHLTLPTSDL